jgi:hypothetical protein
MQSISDREKKGEKRTHHLVSHDATHLTKHCTPAVGATFSGFVAIAATLGPILANGATLVFVDANDRAASATP